MLSIRTGLLLSDPRALSFCQPALGDCSNSDGNQYFYSRSENISFTHLLLIQNLKLAEKCLFSVVFLVKAVAFQGHWE